MFSIVRVIAKLTGRTRGDWEGEPGQRFREGLDSVGNYLGKRGVNIESVADTALTAVSGAACEKHAKALKDYADKEQLEVKTAAMLRSADADARKAEAEATSAEIKAAKDRIELFNAQIDLLKRCGELGIAVVPDERGNPVVTKLPASIDLSDVSPLDLEVNSPEPPPILGKPLSVVTRDTAKFSENLSIKLNPQQDLVEHVIDSISASEADTRR